MDVSWTWTAFIIAPAAAPSAPSASAAVPAHPINYRPIYNDSRLYGNVRSLEKKRRRCRFLSCPWSPSVQSTFLRKHFWKHIWSFIPLKKKKKLLFVLQPSRSFNFSEWMMVIGRHQDVRKIQIWKHSGSCRNHIKHELGKKWTVIKKRFFCFYQRTKAKPECRRLLPKIFSFPRNELKPEQIWNHAQVSWNSASNRIVRPHVWK